MKKGLGAVVKKNLFLSDKVYALYSYKEEKALQENIAYLTAVDSLESTKEIEEFQKKCVAGDAIYSSKNRNKANSRIYGIKASIFKGIEDKDYYFPSVEHGLVLYDFVDDHIIETVRPTIVTFGSFRKQIIASSLGLPVFCVGPYIHYAPEYYDTETLMIKKNKLNKNLLVFPQHSTDAATLTENDKTFIKRIEYESKLYDSVTISAFWWNINDALIKKLKSYGYNVMCNGFREDPKFLSRQRTSIELCDRAIGDGIGTHVGYCLHLGKPYTYFDSGIEMHTTVKQERERLSFRKSIVDQIKNEFRGNSITEKQKKLCEMYWGEGKEKTKEEIYAIYMINKQIVDRSNGNADKYKRVIRALFNDLEKGSRQFQLLEDAMQKETIPDTY